MVRVSLSVVLLLTGVCGLVLERVLQSCNSLGVKVNSVSENRWVLTGQYSYEELLPVKIPVPAPSSFEELLMHHFPKSNLISAVMPQI